MILKKITDDHYVVVDDSEIKEGDWCLYANKFGGKFICQAYVYERTLMFDDGSFKRSLGEGITPQKDECKKITHSTIPKGMMLMEGIKRLSLQEVKELIGEVDVEKKVKDYYEKDTTLNNPSSFKSGYTQALEDNKDRKYTEEDLRNAISETRKGMLYNKKYEDEYIQSLQPKTQWEVEFDETGKLKLI